MKHTIMNVGYVILNELKQANLADEEENSLNAILHPPNVEGTEKIVEDDKENEEVEVAQEESIEEDAKLEKEPGETKDEDGQADEEKKESTEENGTEVEEKKEEPQEIAKVPDVIQKVLLPQKILTRDQVLIQLTLNEHCSCITLAKLLKQSLQKKLKEQR